MPIPVLRAYQRMLPRIQAERLLEALNVAIWGAHWAGMKDYERRKVVNDLTAQARGGRVRAVSGTDGGGETTLYGPDEIMAFLRKHGGVA